MKLGKLIGRPSSTALLFAVFGLAVPIGFGHRLLSADGDLARHLVLGSHILEHGLVFPDVFSHTRAGDPFVAYEWLSEIVLHLVERVGGLAGVALFAALLIAGSVALVTAYLRPRLETALLVPVGCAVAVLTAPHWIARPHLFSFLGLGLLLQVSTRPPSWRRNLALALLFALWANLHPAFAYGLVILWVYLVGDVLDTGTTDRLRANALSAVSAAGATLLTPIGWELHAAVYRHLVDRRALRMLQEFGPPEMTSVHGIIFFGCLTAILLAMSCDRRRPPFSALLPFFAALFAALISRRNIPLFALFAMPLVVNALSAFVSEWHWEPIAEARRSLRAEDATGRTVPWIVGTLVLLVALGLARGKVGPLQVVPNAFSPDVFPVEAVERAREAGLEDRRMFNDYVWGGYILYAWPEQRVYIDSMANFYGGRLMEEYRSVMAVEEGWRTTLRERGIDLLLVEPTSRLAREASGSTEWRVWYEDETAIVLLRRSPTPAFPTRAKSRGPR